MQRIFGRYCFGSYQLHSSYLKKLQTILKMKNAKFNDDIIYYSDVRLINPSGQLVGIFPFAEAYKKAQQQKLDIVLINEKVKPIICKMMNYSDELATKFINEVLKSEQQQTRNKLKTSNRIVKLGSRINPQDLKVKVKQLQTMAESVGTIKVQMVVMEENIEQGKEILYKLQQECKGFAAPEGDIVQRDFEDKTKFQFQNTQNQVKKQLLEQVLVSQEMVKKQKESKGVLDKRGSQIQLRAGGAGGGDQRVLHEVREAVGGEPGGGGDADGEGGRDGELLREAGEAAGGEQGVGAAGPQLRAVYGVPGELEEDQPADHAGDEIQVSTLIEKYTFNCLVLLSHCLRSWAKIKMQLLSTIYEGQPKTRLEELKVLMVGVGGIGCEVLKVVSKLELGELHIIDMDTIEVSNLNRQFLFRKQHRGQHKSLVAKEAMAQMAPQLRVVAHVGAIGSKEFGLSFIAQFDVVVMALDNNETRSYINKACKALGTFFLDGGSMGFKGQAKCYYPSSQLRCFDCNPLVSGQQQYAACTIRSQPSTCVHCVIWAKYLFTQLFSEVQKDDESGILEISNNGDARAIFKQVFVDEIAALKKKAIDLEEVGEVKECSKTLVELQEHTEFPIKELVGMWFHAFNELKDAKTVYDKDEFVHTLFVFASTQLRCHNFGIATQNYHQVKTISGNIIHAIASTNSMVASLEVSKLLHFLFADISAFDHLQHDSYISITADKIQSSTHTTRSPICSSCFPVQNQIHCPFQTTTLGQLAETIGTGISISQQSRLIWDGEDEEQQQAVKDKKLIDVLNAQTDNRLQVVDMVTEETKMILWVLDKPLDQLVMTDCKKPNNKLTINQDLKKEARKRVRVEQPTKPNGTHEKDKQIENKVVKCIDLDDEEEDKDKEKGKEKEEQGKQDNEVILID